MSICYRDTVYDHDEPILIRGGWLEGLITNYTIPNTKYAIPNTNYAIPRMPSQIPSVPSQIPSKPSQTPSMPSQVPSMPSQVPRMPSQIPNTSLFFDWDAVIADNVCGLITVNSFG